MHTHCYNGTILEQKNFVTFFLLFVSVHFACIQWLINSLKFEAYFTIRKSNDHGLCRFQIYLLFMETKRNDSLDLHILNKICLSMFGWWLVAQSEPITKSALCIYYYLLLGLIYWPKSISSFYEWWIDLFGCISESTKLELYTRQAIDESKKKVVLSFSLMLHQNVIIVCVASTDEEYGNIISDSSN